MRFLVLVIGAALADEWNPDKLCFDDEFTRKRCCEARDETCFARQEGLMEAECCNEEGRSWWSDIFRENLQIDSWLYTISDFYTDAQYGEDFGYYYRGRVLLNGSLENAGASEAESHHEGFAHYTTFPMALSPHFGAVVCRKLMAMWSSLGEPETFPVFEFGAGSGQLASDIRELCGNFLGEISDKLSEKSFEYKEFGKIMNKWASRKFLRFRQALQYTIVERSLALVHRQRRRGHEVVIGDAQDPETTCEAVRRDRKFQDAVVISNELIDAFAPAKLRLTAGSEEISDCTAWQETRVLHLADEAAVAEILGDERSSAIRGRTSEVFTDLFASSAVVRAAKDLLLPNTTNLSTSDAISIVLAITSLPDHASDLRLPLFAHQLVLRIRRDRKLQDRLQYVFGLERAAVAGLARPTLLEKSVYREIRKKLKNFETREIAFIRDVLSRRINAPLTSSRCPLFQGWMRRHGASIARVQQHYKSLGYTTTQFGVRLGEEQYMKLVDCMLGSNRGYVLSIDYGANFEALANSISSTPLEDGVSVPPIPPSLLTAGLPTDCQSNWLRCPGFIDYTSFIDFTNVAKTGEELGFITVLYGPQSSLERNLELSPHERGGRAVPPRYEVKEHLTPRTQWRHVISWYGNENLPGVQRWTSFKALVQAKNVDPAALAKVNEWTVNWPLVQEEVDPCFERDFTAYPQTDAIWRAPDGWEKLMSGNFRFHEVMDEYNDMYEEAHLAVQLTDFLEDALGRDGLCRGGNLEMAWWKVKNSRWAIIWNEARIAKILDLLFKHVFGRNWGTEKLAPGICLARKKFAILCGSQ